MTIDYKRVIIALARGAARRRMVQDAGEIVAWATNENGDHYPIHAPDGDAQGNLFTGKFERIVGKSEKEAAEKRQQAKAEAAEKRAEEREARREEREEKAAIRERERAIKKEEREEQNRKKETEKRAKEILKNKPISKEPTFEQKKKLSNAIKSYKLKRTREAAEKAAETIRKQYREIPFEWRKYYHAEAILGDNPLFKEMWKYDFPPEI